MSGTATMAEIHVRAETLMREVGLELLKGEVASCRRHCVKVCSVECPVWRASGVYCSDISLECAFFQPRKVAVSEKPVGPETYCTALCADVCKKYRTQSCPTWFFMHEDGYEVVEGKVGKCISYYLDELLDGRVQVQPFKPSVNVRGEMLLKEALAKDPVKAVVVPVKRPLEKEFEGQGVVCSKCGKLGVLELTPRWGSVVRRVRHYDPATKKTKRCYLSSHGE